jgi:kumamolisin
MSGKKSFVSLLNGRAKHPAGAKRVRTVFDVEETISVTIVVRSISSSQKRQDLLKSSAFPFSNPHLSAKDFIYFHGAKASDLELVKKFARANGFRILEASRAKRCVIVSGTMSQFSRAFQVGFTSHQHEGETYRSFQKQIQLPRSLDGVVDAIFGLENRTLMTHHAFSHSHLAEHEIGPEEVMKAYSFPMNVNGEGQRIAIIELGGGFYHDDIQQYFKKLGTKQPEIQVVEIDGQRNDPGSRDAIKKILDSMNAHPAKATATTADDKAEATKALWTIETTLDVELAGSFANGAKIIVYFASNNAQGKYHALTTALTNEKFPPTLISCSWGATEATLPEDFMHVFDQVLQDAAFRGVTVCFSSGDRGEDPGKDGEPRAHFPASSPHVISCGGTHWMLSAAQKEVVWSEKMPYGIVQSGGGVSKNFAAPDWQSSSGVEWKTKMKGRGLPDVAGKADMASGYGMVVGGYSVAMGGTSSVAPLWTGLVARLNQELGENVGYLTPFLYQDCCGSAFHDVTEGNNGTHFQAWPGWDACTGLGSPNGANLLSALKQILDRR